MKAPLGNWWEPHALCPHPKGTQRMWMSALFFWPPMGVPKQPPPFLHHSHWLSHLGVFASAQLKQHFRGLLMPLSFSFQPQATGPCLSFLWTSLNFTSSKVLGHFCPNHVFPFPGYHKCQFSVPKICYQMNFINSWVSTPGSPWFQSTSSLSHLLFCLGKNLVSEVIHCLSWGKTSALHKWCACYRSVFSSLQVSTKNCLGYYF